VANTMSKAHVILRGTDDQSFHRPPLSSCCGAGVVYLRRDIGRFVGVTNNDHYAHLTLPEQNTARCARCNRSLN
jgi:hypothetical protein